MKEVSAALAAIKGTGQKKLTLPDSGVEVTIRRVAGQDFMGLAALPNLMPHKGAEKTRTERLREAARPTPDKQKLEDWNRQFTFLVFEKGMVDPKVWTGELDETPEDRCHYSDFTSKDRDFVVNEIFRHSGMEVAEEAAPFSEEPTGGEAGQAGEEIQPSAA